jgi:hypothetical protein
VLLRVTTAGTLTNVGLTDPTLSGLSNPGTSVSLATPATGNRYMMIPRTAINPATGNATITFSSLAGPVTYELIRV